MNPQCLEQCLAQGRHSINTCWIRSILICYFNISTASAYISKYRASCICALFPIPVPFHSSAQSAPVFTLSSQWLHPRRNQRKKQPQQQEPHYCPKGPQVPQPDPSSGPLFPVVLVLTTSVGVCATFGLLPTGYVRNGISGYYNLNFSY